MGTAAVVPTSIREFVPSNKVWTLHEHREPGSGPHTLPAITSSRRRSEADHPISTERLPERFHHPSPRTQDLLRYGNSQCGSGKKATRRPTHFQVRGQPSRCECTVIGIQTGLPKTNALAILREQRFTQSLTRPTGTAPKTRKVTNGVES